MFLKFEQPAVTFNIGRKVTEHVEFFYAFMFLIFFFLSLWFRQREHIHVRSILPRWYLTLLHLLIILSVAITPIMLSVVILYLRPESLCWVSWRQPRNHLTFLLKIERNNVLLRKRRYWMERLIKNVIEIFSAAIHSFSLFLFVLKIIFSSKEFLSEF